MVTYFERFYLVLGRLPPVQYSTQKIPKIRNIKRKVIFHIFQKYSSNNVFSANTRSKEKRLIKAKKTPHPPSKMVIAQSRFLVQN